MRWAWPGRGVSYLWRRPGVGPAVEARRSGGGRGLGGGGNPDVPRDIAGFTGRAAELGRLMAGAGCAGQREAWWGSARSAVWPGSARPRWRCTRLTSSRSLPRRPDVLAAARPHPGQRPVDPADALASLLLSGGGRRQADPAGLEERAGRWRDYLAGKKILLVLDDAAGHDQVRPLLPGAAGSLVLVTSRTRLAALEEPR